MGSGMIAGIPGSAPHPCWIIRMGALEGWALETRLAWTEENVLSLEGSVRREASQWTNSGQAVSFIATALSSTPCPHNGDL